ncbi:olfactory receptor 52B2-like [Polymixia lowei]
MFCNLLIFTTIALNRRLHKPMFILLLNLPVNDMIGATAFFPQLVTSIILQNRSISYPACFIQALLMHIYGSGNLLILTAMAYDRYIAICCPLKYNTIMTNAHIMTIITLLICNGTVLYTYLQILVACFKNKKSDTRAKALQTCATHLIVFLLLECLGLFTIISYRLQNLSPHLRRFIGVSTLIFPPTLNPIIYGLKTKEIREKIVHFFSKKIFPL